MFFRMLFFIFVVTSILAKCPSGTTYNAGFAKCYKFYSDQLSFVEAEETCRSIDGHLTAIQNAFENSYVASLVDTASFWIGANMLTSYTWSWTYNVTVGYTNWAVGQPNKANACTKMDSNLMWSTNICNDELPFVCSIDPGADQTVPCPFLSCPEDSTCAEGYSLYTGTCQCYKYFSNWETFANANITCIRDGGELAKVTTFAENSFLSWMPGVKCTSDGWTVGPRCPLIGLSCLENNPESCQWSDGTALHDLGLFWNGVAGAHAVLVADTSAYITGYWVGINETEKNAFICQKDSIRDPAVVLASSAKSTRSRKTAYNVLDQQCPFGTTYQSDTKKCYKFYENELSFVQAEEECQSIGGHLASVHSESENVLVASLTLGSYWLGANTLTSKTWSWIDRTGLIYTNWDKGEPMANNMCAMIKYDNELLWSTTSCNNQQSFLCAMDVGTTAPAACDPNPCPAEAVCSPGYTLFPGTCKCYKYFNQPTYWDQANQICTQDGGMLAKITDDAENDFLTVFPGVRCTKYNYQPTEACPFIGLYCEGKTISTCEWSDGTELEGYYGFESSLSDSYTVILSDPGSLLPGAWESVYSTDKYSFICQKESTRTTIVKSAASPTIN